MVVGVTSADAVVEPDTVRFVSVSALIASLTMVRSRRLDHFAVGAEFASRKFSQELFELKLVLLLAVTILLSSLNVAWIRLDADPEGSE